MATKNELAISKKWSQLTKKEKSRFKNKQSFLRRKQNQLSSQNSVFNVPNSVFNVPTTTYSPFVSAPGASPFGIDSTIPQSVAAPEPTPEPEPFDYDALVASLTESISTPFQGQIDTLTDQLGQANNIIIDNKNDYNTRISELQDTINDYSQLMTGYESKMAGMRDSLRRAQKQANQLKIRDTRYIADNSAGGVRLKRSNKFNSRAFAMGTAQLNRDFKSPLSISNVNL